MHLIKIFLLLFFFSYLNAASNVNYTQKDHTLYEEYVKYLTKNKHINLKDISRLLNSKDRYLSYYEAMLKASYISYKKPENKDKELKNIFRLLDQNDRLYDNFEAFLYMDIKLSLGLMPKQRLTSIYVCRFITEGDLIRKCEKDYMKVVCAQNKNKCFDLVQQRKIY